jgi:O-methyltransferase
MTEASKNPAPEALAADADSMEIIERAAPLTMTSPQRLLALIEAVRHCERRDIEGALAECGVWRGGSVLAMVLTLLSLGSDRREIYLYDTFAGMTEPSEHDVSPYDGVAAEEWNRSQGKPWSMLFDGERNAERAVRQSLEETGYPAELLRTVVGPVEETIPQTMPDRLSLLRLDTDWYESTLHELRHLYPRLSPGGVLIIDDYGHWEGCRRAVDEFFSTEAEPVLLQRIDYTARIAIKA